MLGAHSINHMAGGLNPSHGIRRIASAFGCLWGNRRYITPLKALNIAAVRLQECLGTEFVLGRPYSAMIEPTNVCNTNCQLCPTGEHRPGRAKGFMTWDLYRRFIDDNSRWLYVLVLYMWGDPLIAKYIYQMINYAHRAGIWTGVSSNLHSFCPESGDAVTMIESGLDELICSLHAASQKTFEIYQPGKSFQSAVAKIRSFVQIRDSLGKKRPKVCAHFVVTRFNEHEIPEFRKLAQELRCECAFSTPSLNVRFLSGREPGEARRDSVLKRIEKWLPTDPAYVHPLYLAIRNGQLDIDRLDAFNGRKPFQCVWPWRKTIINWDGTVGPCCGAWNESDSLGDISREPLARVWNNVKYRAARRSFKRPTDVDVPCARCPGILL